MKNKKASGTVATTALETERDNKKILQQLDYLTSMYSKMSEDIKYIKSNMVLEPKFYSIKQASLYMGLEETEILTYCHKKLLPYELPYDGNFYFNKDDLDGFLHNQHYKYVGFEDYRKKNPHHFRVLED